jgi:hypothetical protein
VEDFFQHMKHVALLLERFASAEVPRAPA